MDTSTKEELFRKVWAALYEEGNKDELQVREVVDQMYMAVKEPELDIEEVFDKVQREIGTVRNKERRLWWNVIKYIIKSKVFTQCCVYGQRAVDRGKALVV